MATGNGKGLTIIISLIILPPSPHTLTDKYILVTPLCSPLRAICPGLGAVLNNKTCYVCSHFSLSLTLLQLLILSPFFSLHLSLLLFLSIPLIESISCDFASLTPACPSFSMSLCPLPTHLAIDRQRQREKRKSD